MKSKSKIVSLMAGIVAPLLFVGIFTIAGWLRVDYNPFAMYISALSLGSRGRVQIANFIVLGLLLLYFMRTIKSPYYNTKASKVGYILVFITAILFLLSGPFIMDPMGTPPQDATIHGIIHSILGALIFTLMPVSCFVFFYRFRKDSKRKHMTSLTIIIAFIVAVAVILLIVATKFPSLKEFFIPRVGLIQRCVIIPYMLWLSTFAYGVYKQKDSFTSYL